MSIDTAKEPQPTAATLEDMAFIRETVERLRLDPEDLQPEQITTLRRDGRIISFGRIKP